MHNEYATKIMLLRYICRYEYLHTNLLYAKKIVWHNYIHFAFVLTSYAPWASGRPAGRCSGRADLHDACGSSLAVSHPAAQSLWRTERRRSRLLCSVRCLSSQRSQIFAFQSNSGNDTKQQLEFSGNARHNQHLRGKAEAKWHKSSCYSSRILSRARFLQDSSLMLWGGWFSRCQRWFT